MDSNKEEGKMIWIPVRTVYHKELENHDINACLPIISEEFTHKILKFHYFHVCLQPYHHFYAPVSGA